MNFNNEYIKGTFSLGAPKIKVLRGKSHIKQDLNIFVFFETRKLSSKSYHKEKERGKIVLKT